MALFIEEIISMEQQTHCHMHLYDQTSRFGVLEESYIMILRIWVYKGSSLYLSLELWKNMSGYIPVPNQHQQLNKHQEELVYAPPLLQHLLLLYQPPPTTILYSHTEQVLVIGYGAIFVIGYGPILVIRYGTIFVIGYGPIFFMGYGPILVIGCETTMCSCHHQNWMIYPIMNVNWINYLYRL